jgi:LysM repeat protein
VLAGLVALFATLTTSLVVTERLQALREPAAPVPATAPAEVVVAPGETLWSIAERVAPDRDPRGVVDQIRRINHLPSGDVQAGQTLLLRP